MRAVRQELVEYIAMNSYEVDEEKKGVAVLF
jgi:hypothetical protein